MSERPLRIATRSSRLALWQARHVAELLRQAAPDRAVELVEVTTAGDSNRLQPLRDMGGVGVFTREVQSAVLDGRADLAVHSLKDLPTECVPGLMLAAVPRRGPAFDRLVLPADRSSAASLEELPAQARVGTGSLRRQAQLLSYRPDLQLSDVRGNVETRLRKLDGGEYDALVLAEAGLERLGLIGGRQTVPLHPPVMYPAVGQGAIAIECRADAEDVSTALVRLSHDDTFQAVLAERTVLAELRAGCHAPLGVSSVIDGDRFTLEAVVLSPDGKQRLCASHTGPADNPADVGRAVVDKLREQGADRLIAHD